MPVGEGVAGRRVGGPVTPPLVGMVVGGGLVLSGYVVGALSALLAVHTVSTWGAR